MSNIIQNYRLVQSGGRSKQDDKTITYNDVDTDLVKLKGRKVQ